MYFGMQCLTVTDMDQVLLQSKWKKEVDGAWRIDIDIAIDDDNEDEEMADAEKKKKKKDKKAKRKSEAGDDVEEDVKVRNYRMLFCEFGSTLKVV